MPTLVTRRPDRELPAERPPVSIGPSNFTCAPPEPPLQRRAVRAIEAVTGRRYILRLYDDASLNPGPGENFWAAMLRRLDVKVDYDQHALARVPKTGPLLIVANHPFGVLDGVMMGYLVSRARPDFVLLTSSVVFANTRAINNIMLPVDLPKTKDELELNRTSRAAAIAHLSQGGAVGIFPAGIISTAAKWWGGRAVDSRWKNLASRLILSARAPVLPIYIHGQNSRAFQIASHVSSTLRRSLFFNEIRAKIGCVLRVEIGDAIPYGELESLDRAKLVEHLRRTTYDLPPLTSLSAQTARSRVEAFL